MKRIRRCTKEPCDICDGKEALLHLGMVHLLSPDDVTEDPSLYPHECDEACENGESADDDSH